MFKKNFISFIICIARMSKSTKEKQLKLDKMLASKRSRSPSLSDADNISKKTTPSVSESETELKKEKKPTIVAPIFSKTVSMMASANLDSIDSFSCSLQEKIREKRHDLYESIEKFKFNKKRVRILSDCSEMKQNGEGIVYWMSREQRVQDNWSLLYAQRLALKQNQPLYVCFCLVPTHLNATYRHYHFMLEGLKEVEMELKMLNITFVLLMGLAKDRIPEFVIKNNISGVICDFSPLRVALNWVSEIKKNLPKDVPLAQVDGHNVVPCWHASDKLEYAARTIRNKINSKLDEFLTEFPPVIRHLYDSKNLKLEAKVDWNACYESLECDKKVKLVDWAKPGYRGGIKVLEEFIQTRLKTYDEERNDPNKNALSNLSPWYHFGQISVQRANLEIKKYSSKYSKSVQAYMEESIVRRELSENFCFYQPNYDSIEGTNDWAKKTLNDHLEDKRPYLYTLEDLDNFRTHDRLWNAAQIQMRVEGKMHGFLRMYWAKKILEWTENPKQALEFAIYLNDRYQLDGRDPNGYVGCMWSICGIHDQGWTERAVFGKVRYMNYEGCKRKFDIEKFINKYYAKRNLC